MNETETIESRVPAPVALHSVASPRSRADSIIKDILDNHLPRIIEGLKAGYVDENQILVVYDHAVRARVLKEHDHQIAEMVKVLEEVAEYDTGEQPCIGSDAKAVLSKWANDQAQRRRP